MNLKHVRAVCGYMLLGLTTGCTSNYYYIAGYKVEKSGVHNLDSKKIESAAKRIDTNEDGTISATELENIVSRIETIGKIESKLESFVKRE